MLLQSCAGFVIHDEARSKIATDTKQSYADAKITEVPKADAKNLETLLAAELEVLRDASRTELDFALLALANNTTPMGFTVVNASDRLKELGIPSLQQLRDVGKRLSMSAGEVRKLRNDGKMLEGWDNVKAPACQDGILATVPLPKDATDDQKKKDFQNDYDVYRNRCLAILKLIDLSLQGKIGAAFLEWQSAQSALDESVDRQKAEAAKVKAAKKAYDEVVAARAEAAKKGQDLSEQIADKAKKLAEAVAAAKKVDKGVENDAFIDSLIDLLTATAGGDVSPKDPGLQGAVAVAKLLPSLAGDMAALEANRTAPPVSLLIALRHQTLLAENAKKRAALAAERVDILKTKYDLYLKAADRWQLYFDASCNYAVVGSGKPYPRGTACDKFSVTKDIENKTIECRLDDVVLAPCLLAQTWKKQLRGHQDQPVLKRQLYESVAAYLQAVTLQARPLEQSMREIDVRHRETLVAKQTAIEQWDNLVGVPLEQLEAYYKAGVKPAELADLIVKALGFTAIAIGVSK